MKIPQKRRKSEGLGHVCRVEWERGVSCWANGILKEEPRVGEDENLWYFKYTHVCLMRSGRGQASIVFILQSSQNTPSIYNSFAGSRTVNLLPSLNPHTTSRWRSKSNELVGERRTYNMRMVGGFKTVGIIFSLHKCVVCSFTVFIFASPTSTRGSFTCEWGRWSERPGEDLISQESVIRHRSGK